MKAQYDYTSTQGDIWYQVTGERFLDSAMVRINPDGSMGCDNPKCDGTKDCEHKYYARKENQRLMMQEKAVA